MVEVIILFRPLGESEKREVRAEIRPPESILVEDGEILDPDLWKEEGCRLIEADEDEMKSLRRMGLL